MTIEAPEIIENSRVEKIPKPVVKVLSSDDILSKYKDDLSLLTAHTMICRETLTYDRHLLRILKILDDAKVPEQGKREFVEFAYKGVFHFDNLVPAGRISSQSDYSRVMSAAMALMRSRTYIDENTEAFLKLLEEDSEISSTQLLREKISSTSQETSLVELQLEIVRQQLREAKKKRREQAVSKPDKATNSSKTTKDIENDLVAASQSVENVGQSKTKVSDDLDAIPYPLLGWGLYWSEQLFSSVNGNLVSIPTESRSQTLYELSPLVGDKVSIPVRSVLGAVEMYARMTPVQRARVPIIRINEHNGENGDHNDSDIVNWIKFKRGGNRIFVASLDGEKEIAFFAAQRKEVYRGI